MSSGSGNPGPRRPTLEERLRRNRESGIEAPEFRPLSPGTYQRLKTSKDPYPDLANHTKEWTMADYFPSTSSEQQRQSCAAETPNDDGALIKQHQSAESFAVQEPEVTDDAAASAQDEPESSTDAQSLALPNLTGLSYTQQLRLLSTSNIPPLLWPEGLLSQFVYPLYQAIELSKVVDTLQEENRRIRAKNTMIDMLNWHLQNNADVFAKEAENMALRKQLSTLEDDIKYDLMTRERFHGANRDRDIALAKVKKLEERAERREKQLKTQGENLRWCQGVIRRAYPDSFPEEAAVEGEDSGEQEAGDTEGGDGEKSGEAEANDTQEPPRKKAKLSDGGEDMGGEEGEGDAMDMN